MKGSDTAAPNLLTGEPSNLTITMNTRTLGKNGLTVPALPPGGTGTSGFYAGRDDDNQSLNG